MTIDEKIEQYKWLKATQRNLNKRLTDLREDIMLHIDPSGAYRGLKLQRRDRTSFNEDRVEEVMKARGIDKEEYCTLVVSPGAIETLYLEGTLDDSDLRYIREPKVSFALVEAGDEEDVQELNESNSERV